MDTFFELKKIVAKTPCDHIKTEIQEMPEYFEQINFFRSSDFGIVRRYQARHINVEPRLKGSMLEQIGHSSFRIGSTF